jgi:hypothetical protein
MSRAYRVRVSQKENRVVRASDHVSTQLQILGVLPPEEMAALLGQELEKRGFEHQGEQLVRQQNGVTVIVEPATATVTVRAEGEQEVQVEGTKEGYAADQEGPAAKKVEQALRKELQRTLRGQAAQHKEKLQGQLTDRLEAELGGLRKELDQVVNRVTADALKRKAAQLGQIKELTEDPQSGSMTIVLEV